MGPDLEKAIQDLSLRMRMIRAIQEDHAAENALTEREAMILQQLAEQGSLSASQISESWPDISDSTLSMSITKLRRKRGLVTKPIKPDNQRVTMVELSEKGKAELAEILKQRSERFQALFKAINVSPEEKTVLIDVCQRGVKFLDKMLGFKKASDTK